MGTSQSFHASTIDASIVNNKALVHIKPEGQPSNLESQESDVAIHSSSKMSDTIHVEKTSVLGELDANSEKAAIKTKAIREEPIGSTLDQELSYLALHTVLGWSVKDYEKGERAGIYVGTKNFREGEYSVFLSSDGTTAYRIRSIGSEIVWEVSPGFEGDLNQALWKNISADTKTFFHVGNDTITITELTQDGIAVPKVYTNFSHSRVKVRNSD